MGRQVLYVSFIKKNYSLVTPRISSLYSVFFRFLSKDYKIKFYKVNSTKTNVRD